MTPTEGVKAVHPACALAEQTFFYNIYHALVVTV